MTADPLVSVICTVRNAASTIEMTLQSIQRQTFRSWEMIVVDDGSTDPSPVMVEAYDGRDPRIRLIRSSGLGRGRALNHALGCARAAFVANLDADDLSHPQRLAIQYETMREDRAITVLCTDILRVRQDEQPVWPDFEHALPHLGVDDVTCSLVLRNPVVHSSVMLRKEDVLAVWGYAEDLASQFDYELWVRMAAKGYRIHKLALPLTAKRLHDEQSFGTRRRRLSYLRNSARIQSQAIRHLGAPQHYMCLVWGRFMFGFLPRPLRGLLQGKLWAVAAPPRPWLRAIDSERGKLRERLAEIVQQRGRR